MSLSQFLGIYSNGITLKTIKISIQALFTEHTCNAERLATAQVHTVGQGWDDLWTSSKWSTTQLQKKPEVLSLLWSDPQHTIVSGKMK